MPHTLGTLGQQQNPAAEIDALGPIAWWRLNDTSGSTAVAKVGPNGTYRNSPTLDSGTLAIDGSSFTAAGSPTRAVEIPVSTNDISQTRTAFTMTAFCLTTDITTSGNQVLFEIGGQREGNAIHITDFDDIDCMAWSAFTVFRSRIRVTNYLETNKIYHIAYGYDSAGPTTVLYVNGESVGTVITNTGATIDAPTASLSGIGASIQSTRNAIGAYGDNAFPWRGRIGDVAYFDYLLTQNQVRRVARQMMTT